MATRPYSYQRYQCMHCAQGVHLVVDAGRTRRLWCGRCACTRTFERLGARLRAETWPPAERQVVRLVPKEED